MNERNLRVLEFPKIRARMAALATTEMGRACALELMPSSDPFLVRRMQQQTEGLPRCWPTTAPTPWRRSPTCGPF